MNLLSYTFYIMLQFLINPPPFFAGTFLVLDSRIIDSRSLKYLHHMTVELKWLYQKKT